MRRSRMSLLPAVIERRGPGILVLHVYLWDYLSIYGYQSVRLTIRLWYILNSFWVFS